MLKPPVKASIFPAPKDSNEFIGLLKFYGNSKYRCWVIDKREKSDALASLKAGETRGWNAEMLVFNSSIPF